MSLTLNTIRVAGCLFALMPLLCTANPAAELGLRKSGEAELKWFGLAIYTASLWSSSALPINENEPRPLLLSITYHRDVSKARIIKSTDKEWRRLGQINKNQRKSWLAELERILPDVGAGDSLSSVVIPGGETTFYIADRPIGTVYDPDFGSAFLAIWLDPDSRFPQQRRRLLSGMNAGKSDNTGIDL